MRYESKAYGTREEILKTLRDRIGSSGSPRRNEESTQAINELETGATVVITRGHHYVVTGEHLGYLAELDDGSIERLEARSNTEAWTLAHQLQRRVVRLYRDVTMDES
ncbi:MAG: hypothetical protein WBA97_31790 [Actinophytocola sp.]|uniref:hypothetical protein n=1 Tax=Actinophytocola sp. TaxID=1872138 RepID=UPI003C768EA9